jgi:hypothetical protein
LYGGLALSQLHGSTEQQEDVALYIALHKAPSVGFIQNLLVMADQDARSTGHSAQEQESQHMSAHGNGIQRTSMNRYNAMNFTTVINQPFPTGTGETIGQEDVSHQYHQSCSYLITDCQPFIASKGLEHSTADLG